jgi:hypothetical protein
MAPAASDNRTVASACAPNWTVLTTAHLMYLESLGYTGPAPTTATEAEALIYEANRREYPLDQDAG